MKDNDLTEMAYKNGYEKAKQDIINMLKVTKAFHEGYAVGTPDEETSNHHTARVTALENAIKQIEVMMK